MADIIQAACCRAAWSQQLQKRGRAWCGHDGAACVLHPAGLQPAVPPCCRLRHCLGGQVQTQPRAVQARVAPGRSGTRGRSRACKKGTAEGAQGGAAGKWLPRDGILVAGAGGSQGAVSAEVVRAKRGVEGVGTVDEGRWPSCCCRACAAAGERKGVSCRAGAAAACVVEGAGGGAALCCSAASCGGCVAACGRLPASDLASSEPPWTEPESTQRTDLLTLPSA
eukprot:1018872-Pelagomonas_calceolata.AAC.1